MMTIHPKAREFDRRMGRDEGDESPPPRERPCEVCGLPVGVPGRYIHPRCHQEEQEKWGRES